MILLVSFFIVSEKFQVQLILLGQLDHSLVLKTVASYIQEKTIFSTAIVSEITINSWMLFLRYFLIKKLTFLYKMKLSCSSICLPCDLISLVPKTSNLISSRALLSSIKLSRVLWVLVLSVAMWNTSVLV